MGNCNFQPEFESEHLTGMNFEMCDENVVFRVKRSY